MPEPINTEGSQPTAHDRGVEVTHSASDSPRRQMQPPETRPRELPTYDQLLDPETKAALAAHGFGPEELALLTAIDSNTGGVIPPEKEEAAAAIEEKIEGLDEVLIGKLGEAQQRIIGARALQQQAGEQGPVGEQTTDSAAFRYEGLPRDIRTKLEENGIERAKIEELFSYGGIIPEERAEAIGELIREIGDIDPDLPKRLVELVGTEIPNHLPKAPTDASELSDPTTEQGYQNIEDQDAIRTQRETEAAVLSAQEALKRAMNNTDRNLDTELWRDAEEKLHKAREHHDKHEADSLQKGDPWWSTALKILGVAFYMYVGMQYGAAVLTQNAAKGTGK